MSQVVKISILWMLILLSGCKSRRESYWFDKGEDRANIYSEMGVPDNSDDDVVAIWLVNKKDKADTSASWKDLVAEGNDPIIAIFGDDDKSIFYKMTASQLQMPTNLDNKALLQYFESIDP